MSLEEVEEDLPFIRPAIIPPSKPKIKINLRSKGNAKKCEGITQDNKDGNDEIFSENMQNDTDGEENDHSGKIEMLKYYLSKEHNFHRASLLKAIASLLNNPQAIEFPVKYESTLLDTLEINSISDIHRLIHKEKLRLKEKYTQDLSDIVMVACDLLKKNPALKDKIGICLTQTANNLRKAYSEKIATFIQDTFY